MKASRSAHLLRLQQSLTQHEHTSEGGVVLDVLPFEAAGSLWGVPSSDVTRVLMPADVIELAGYSQLPRCVVGVVACEDAMLSVVDASQLLGRVPARQSLKARLIVFGDGALKGIAMLVDRVKERVSNGANEQSGAMTKLDAQTLHARLVQQRAKQVEQQ